MLLKKEIARRLLRELPESIFNHIFKNEQFQTFWAEDTFNIHGERFSYATVSGALDLASSSHNWIDISSLSGAKFSVRVAESKVFLSHQSKEEIIDDLNFLLPEPQARVEAFERVRQNCFPLLVDHSIRDLLFKRKPTESELNKLMLLEKNSPSQFILELTEKIQHASSLKMVEVIPNYPEYFLNICGPDPEALDFDSWFSDVFLPYWKKIISINNTEGLRYFLSIGLFSSKNVDSIFLGICPKDIAECFNRLQDSCCPFIHVGIAKYSASLLDAESTTRIQLVSTSCDWLKSSFDDNANSYISWRILSILFHATLERISSIEKICSYPVYWRRLAAFAHANILVDVIFSHASDIDGLLKWIGGQSQGFTHSGFLIDLALDPLWSAFDISENHVKALAVFQLITAEKNIDDDKLLGVVNDLMGKLQEIDRMAISPINSIIREKIISPMPEEFSFLLEDKIYSDLSDNYLSDKWNFLAIFAKHFDFGEHVLNKLADFFYEGNYHLTEINDSNTESLFYAAAVASIQQSTKLANAIVSCVLKLAPKANDVQKVDICFVILAFASGAIVASDIRRTWFQEQVTSLAFILPSGPPLARLLERLEILERHLPLVDRVFSQAKKLAAGAK